MSTKRILSASFAAALLTVAHTGSPMAKTLKCWANHAMDYPVNIGMVEMGKIIKEKTGGKYEIKVFPSGTLGDENSIIDQIRGGIVDCGTLNSGPLSEIVQEIKFLNLPYLFKSPDHMLRVMNSPVGREIDSLIVKYDLFPVAYYGSGARSFYTTNKPIKTPEDLEGLKVRVMSTAVFVDTVNALGAKATPMPFPEVYTALKTGVVDGAENNWPSYESTGHFEVAKYYSLDRHTVTPEPVVFSAKLWNSLSDEEKKIFKDAGVASQDVMYAAWDKRVEKSKEIALKGGAQVFEIDPAPFQAKVKPVWDKYVTDAETKSLIERIKAVK
jgi:tripartite ATP-independent transporter DctP family solute receptor